MATIPRGRAPQLSPDAHRLYRALIDHVIAAGTAPSTDALTRGTGLDERRVSEALAELVEREWAGRDTHGHLTALFPFATRPTGVRVRLGDAEREAMCAIDALGVAPMLARSVAVSSACAVCGAPLRLTVTPEGVTEAEPGGVVVIRRRTPGPAHLTRCDATRFACSPAHGAAWLREHGGSDDLVEPLAEAFEEGRRLFGDAYRHGRCDCDCQGATAGTGEGSCAG